MEPVPATQTKPIDWTLITRLTIELGHKSVLVCTSEQNEQPPGDELPTIKTLTADTAQQHQHPEAFVVVYDCIDTLSPANGQMLLGHLKNLISPNILVVTPTQSNWKLTDFIAMGFKAISSPLLQQNGYTGYYYDLCTYNHKRTWNNPKFWANPENFNKFRW